MLRFFLISLVFSFFSVSVLHLFSRFVSSRSYIEHTLMQTRTYRRTRAQTNHSVCFPVLWSQQALTMKQSSTVNHPDCAALLINLFQT